MVNKYTTTQEEERIAEQLYINFAQIPIFEENHSIFVRKREEKTHITYWTASKQYIPEQTRVSFTIDRETCDILEFDIEESQRGKGYGRQIYETIETFAKNRGCTKMQTSPSGEGVGFWPKMGFNEPCSFGLEKKL